MVDFGDNPPPWLFKLVIRLLSLRTPGVYEILLVVEEDGGRSIIIKNASTPHRKEDLSKEKEGKRESRR